MIFGYILLCALIAQFVNAEEIKSRAERCAEIQMTFDTEYNDGCIFTCKREKSVTNDKDNATLKNNDEVDDLKDLVTEDGAPCANKGHCERGICYNMTITTIISNMSSAV